MSYIIRLHVLCTDFLSGVQKCLRNHEARNLHYDRGIHLPIFSKKASKHASNMPKQLVQLWLRLYLEQIVLSLRRSLDSPCSPPIYSISIRRSLRVHTWIKLPKVPESFSQQVSLY